MLVQHRRLGCYTYGNIKCFGVDLTINKGFITIYIVPPEVQGQTFLKCDGTHFLNTFFKHLKSYIY